MKDHLVHSVIEDAVDFYKSIHSNLRPRRSELVSRLKSKGERRERSSQDSKAVESSRAEGTDELSLEKYVSRHERSSQGSFASEDQLGGAKLKSKGSPLLSNSLFTDTLSLAGASWSRDLDDLITLANFEFLQYFFTNIPLFTSDCKLSLTNLLNNESSSTRTAILYSFRADEFAFLVENLCYKNNVCSLIEKQKLICCILRNLDGNCNDIEMLRTISFPFVKYALQTSHKRKDYGDINKTVFHSLPYGVNIGFCLYKSIFDDNISLFDFCCFSLNDYNILPFKEALGHFEFNYDVDFHTIQDIKDALFKFALRQWSSKIVEQMVIKWGMKLDLVDVLCCVQLIKVAKHLGHSWTLETIEKLSTSGLKTDVCCFMIKHADCATEIEKQNLFAKLIMPRHDINLIVLLAIDFDFKVSSEKITDWITQTDYFNHTNFLSVWNNSKSRRWVIANVKSGTVMFVDLLERLSKKRKCVFYDFGFNNDVVDFVIDLYL